MTLSTRVFVAGAVAVAAAAQPAPRPFRYERPIVSDGAGPRRLQIDVPLLVGGAPFRVEPRPTTDVVRARDGLADLRVFDASGREVPYLLIGPAEAEKVWAPATLLPVAATKKTSGFEADLGASLVVDRLAVSGLPSPILKRVMLEGSGDRQRWTLLAGEGTLFDLPDDSLRQTELMFAAGAYRYLRVTWDDTNTGRVPLPPRVAARRVAAGSAPRGPTTPLQVERRPSEPGRSRYHVRLPGPHLPIAALLLDVEGAHVLRPIEVSESRLSGIAAAPAILGRAVLRRVVRGTIAAADLRVPIEAPAEAEIDLTVEDADNPPLALKSIAAELADLPWIYVESDGSPLVARYGGGAREAPRYDLEAARDAVSRTIETVRAARWGEARQADPAASSTPGPLPTEGAPVDASLFRHVRDVPPGEVGLATLPLDAAVLAGSAGPDRGFADVRIIDAGGRQVPYLLERRGEPLSLDVALERTTSDLVDQSSGPRSAYRVRLPYASLPECRLVLSTTARVFDRPVAVGVVRDADRRHRGPWLMQVRTARWLHADRDRPALDLMLPLGPTAQPDLLVIVDEGDNRTLPLGPARLLLPSFRLRFYRPAGEALRLAYGRDDLAPPRYDLALLASQVLGVAAVDSPPASPEIPRPESGAPTWTSPVWFWVVLVAAVVVLLGFVVKLVGRSDPGPVSH